MAAQLILEVASQVLTDVGLAVAAVRRLPTAVTRFDDILVVDASDEQPPWWLFAVQVGGQTVEGELETVRIYRSDSELLAL